MNARKYVIAASALALALGAFGTAQAWNGDFGHHPAKGHQIAAHGYDQLPLKLVAASFNEHGGGHETAPNNAGIHEAEMRNPNHQNPMTPNPKAQYNEHGGGHETAPDNGAIHEKEMRDPNHKDVIG